MKILFVCTGNICRSPMAEGILRSKLGKSVRPGDIDSAGMEEFHVGDPPDDRAQATARKHGVNISGHRARLVTKNDFDAFDRIYVMDSYHFHHLSRLAGNTAGMAKVDYILNAVHPGQNLPVPDPWYDGMSAFDRVFAMLDEACDVIAGEIRDSG